MEPLVVERQVAAPPERVWDLWTTVAGLASWWWTFLDGTIYRVEPLVGGEYRIENRAAAIGVRGTFTAVDAPRRFVATWVWLDGTTEGPVEQIEVGFAAHAGGTLLTITHRGPWTSDEPAAAYRQGWNDTLAALLAVVASPS